MPKISVIVPVYNVEKYICKCVHSLLTQSLEEVEYIFIDDCSTDNSFSVLCDVIKQYPVRESRVRIIRNQENLGAAGSRNVGLSYSNGEFIAYCDSDDYLHPDAYRLMYTKAVDTNSDVVLCDVYMDYGTHMDVYKTIDVSDRKTMLKSYIESEGTFLVNMLVRKELLERYNLKNAESIVYCEDFYLSVMQLYYANKIEKVSLPLYYYNRSNENSVMHKFNPKYVADERWVYEKIIDFFREKGMLCDLERELSWRVLKNKQDLVLSKESHNDFMSIFPISHQYIPSCPLSYCNRKIKIMMWLLVHNLTFMLACVLYLRRIMKKYHV